MSLYEPAVSTYFRTLYGQADHLPQPRHHAPYGSNLATFTGEVSEEMKNYYGLRARGGTA